MGKKILIIDDDRTIRAMLEKTLILQGFWVYSAKDGEEGSDIAKKERPDLVICDFLIPKIHGLDVCKIIKTTPELFQTKVIMMTGVYKGSFGPNEAKSCGADDFFPKPLDMSKIVERVYELLEVDPEEFKQEFVKIDSEEGSQEEDSSDESAPDKTEPERAEPDEADS
jgi:DNA-binding response OmpR family regulator